MGAKVSEIGLQIMRRAVYTDGSPCQIVLTEIDGGRGIVSFHDDTGDDDVIGVQQIAVVVPDCEQFASDAGALFHRAGRAEC